MTTAEIAREIGRTRRHVNRVVRDLFGEPDGYRRLLTPEQHERVLRVFNQPGRKKIDVQCLPQGQRQR